MAIFEYKPHYHVTEPMTSTELAQFSGKRLSIIRHRIEAVNGKCMPGTKRFDVDVCNAALNARCDRENWIIDGYYPLSQVSKMLGVTPSTVHNLLKEFGLSYKHQTIHGIGSVWIAQETFDYIVDKLGTAKNTAESDYMSSRQIAEICDVDREYVNVYAKRLGISKVNIRGKYYFLKSETPQLIEEILKAHGGRVKKNGNDDYYTEMKKKHPLVKDMRCFDMFWFPSPMPEFMLDW